MSHPRIDERVLELKRLVAAVRELNLMLNNHKASADETVALADELAAIVAELEKSEAPFENRFGSMGTDGDPRSIFPFDVMLGPFNPIAPHIEVSHDGDEARGEVTFTKPYEGPPGCCHGGVLTASFDQVFNIANIMGGVPGMTASLSVDYRRPTRLNEPTVFRAWIDNIDGRKVLTRGVAEQAGEVTCEAEGLFVQFAPPPSV